MPDGGDATRSMNQPSGDSSARSICDGETGDERLGVALEVDERGDGRRLGEPVPVVGMRPGHALLGEQRERRGGLAVAASRTELASERADEAAQVERADAGRGRRSVA